MEFLGVGPMELAFIVLIALILIGPRDLAKTARSAGRFLNRLYRSQAWKTLNEASQNIRTLPNRLAREAELEELKEVKQTLDQTREALNPAKNLTGGLQAWTNPPVPKEPGPAQSPTAPSQSSVAEGMRAWTEPPTPSDSGTTGSQSTSPQREG